MCLYMMLLLTVQSFLMRITIQLFAKFGTFKKQEDQAVVGKLLDIDTLTNGNRISTL